jgi:hypothetical protein
LPPEEGYVQGNQTEDDGTAVITGDALVSGGGFAVSVVLFDSLFQGPRVMSSSDATAVFSGTSLIEVDFNNPFDGGKLALNGQVIDPRSDGIIGWGRWVGDVTQTLNVCDGPCTPTVVSYGPNQGLHYVIGTPTASMPNVGTARYSLLGATSPTYVDGRTLPGTFSGDLSVDFVKLTVGMSLNAAMPGGVTYMVGGSTAITGSTFDAPFGTLAVTGTSGVCSLGNCNASVQGFFAGSAAERAGLAYTINDPNNSANVVGAAAFVKQ